MRRKIAVVWFCLMLFSNCEYYLSWVVSVLPRAYSLGGVGIDLGAVPLGLGIFMMGFWTFIMVVNLGSRIMVRRGGGGS